jgi:hypothetical protein
MAALLLPAFVAVGPACNGDWSFDLPVEAAAPDTRYASACTAWAKSLCAYEQLCEYSVWESVDQCVAREALSCELIADDPNVIFDEERINECKYPADCESAIPECWGTGRASAGSPCLWGQACQSGVCIGSDPSTSSTICGLCGGDLGQPCTSPSGCFSNSCGGYSASHPGQQVCGPFAKLGDTCGMGMPLCAAGLACSNAGGQSYRCAMPTPYASPGQPCDSSLHCSSGACVSTASGTEECAPFASLGAACGTDTAYCAIGLACRNQEDDAEAGHCVVSPVMGYGAACNAEEDTCAGFGACAGNCTSSAENGPLCCVPPIEDGQPCNETLYVGCLPPAQCIAGRCIFPALGDCAP